MRLWRSYWQDLDLGARQSWHASKRDAEKSLAALRRQAREERDERQLASEVVLDLEPAGVEPVEVPTTKAALVAWLNAECINPDG